MGHLIMKISENAQQIIESRYLKDNEQTWDDIAVRVGTEIGGAEYGERYSSMLSDMLFVPAGRILRNAGRNRGSLFNCYCLPIGDSREEIGDLFKNALILWGEGGGIGINFSTLRPIHSPIKGVGGRSSGLVSFMRAVDGIAATIESGGQRRAASLGLCEVSHPEIEGFIDSKFKDGDISYFNISVGITEKFIEAVRNQDEWPLHFRQQVEKRIPATDLWNKIIKNMIHNGDPGLINMSNLTRNNSYYFAPVRGTNPCGETCLEDYGVCNLGSLVLPQFVVGGRVQWSKLEGTIEYAIRFLDSCIDRNKYTLDRIKQTAQRGRRIGLGVMGLADMLFSLRLRYGSDDAIDFVGKLFKRIRNYAYKAEVKLATEKGSFPAFDGTLYSKASFIRTLPPSLRKDIRNHGTRNVTCLAIAPTGTISLIADCTSSIEPLYAKAYERNDRVSRRVYIHPSLTDTEKNSKKDGKKLEVPQYIVDTQDLLPQEHIDTQIETQRYVDGAVSKTINLPISFTADNLSSLLLESIQDLKGITVYRDGSRKGQIINRIPDKDIHKYINVSTDEASKETVQCARGTCEI